MERIKRITMMENHFDISDKAINDFLLAFEQYISARDSISAIDEYYSSPLWLSDYSADENGELPKDLKRGVLSQDAVYDILCKHKELIETIKNSI